MVRNDGQSTKMEHNRFSHIIRVHKLGYGIVLVLLKYYADML